MNIDQIKTLLGDAIASVPDVVWAATAGVTVLFLLWQAKRAITRAATPGADLLTYAAAAIATGVSMQGMWHFFEVVFPDLPVPLRVALFAFIEIGMLASAVRARRNMRDSAARAKTDPLVRPSAGIDGTAVWVLTGLTAVLSSLEAASPPEFIFRLAAPLVAAWLWERGMAIERQRITGRTRINWRLTPERILVRLGLAEANDRTASEVDAHRRLTRVALAAKKAKALRDGGAKPKKLARALARLDKAMDKAVEHTAVSRDRRVMAALLDQVSTLYGAPRLLDLPGQAPWEHLDHPAVTGLIRDSEAIILAAALDRNTALRGEVYPLPIATSDRLATTAATGRGAETLAAPDADEAPSIADEGRSWLTNLVPWSRPEPRPVANEAADHQPVAEVVAAPVAGDAPDAGVVATGRRPVADREKPTEQDRRRAIRFWIGRAKKLNPPSKRTLAEWTGFSETWALGCIQEARQTMIAEGWSFDEKGTPTPPRPVATTPSIKTVNGAQQ
ncbi:hypothetical protein [Nonomuraea turcica]|uniref:hypothetical protein n=1 Tax=Nonomuraea sp. G32 TaxID=3067274 RepID=UPI00273CBF57|nr:hypothetical protein [Nonomuraea sp. G32]MDP4501122.1 hypothetical protein [Nonomuraea sp. G32]